MLYTKKQKSKDKKTSYSLVRTVLACALFMLGLAVYAFPLVNRAVSANNIQTALEIFHNARAETSADESGADSESSTDSESSADTESSSDASQSSESSSSSTADSIVRSYDGLYKEMQEYNEKIYEEKQVGLKDAWSYEQAEFDLYQYNVANGVVGELVVPAMDCDLPLYLGATLWNMAQGATQLGQTSMPIGGENTNCVIAGHRGCTNGRYFLDIENISIGDMVYINNLWETLAYRVTDIQVISPTDIDKVKIQEGKDMVTLITCHPYPYNYQRYAVFCERTEYTADEAASLSSSASSSGGTAADSDLKKEENTSKSDGGSELFIVFEDIMVVLTPVSLVLLAVLLILHGHRRRKRHENEKQDTK